MGLLDSPTWAGSFALLGALAGLIVIGAIVKGLWLLLVRRLPVAQFPAHLEATADRRDRRAKLRAQAKQRPGRIAGDTVGDMRFVHAALHEHDAENAAVWSRTRPEPPPWAPPQGRK